MKIYETLLFRIIFMAFLYGIVINDMASCNTIFKNTISFLAFLKAIPLQPIPVPVSAYLQYCSNDTLNVSVSTVALNAYLAQLMCTKFNVGKPQANPVILTRSVHVRYGAQLTKMYRI